MKEQTFTLSLTHTHSHDLECVRQCFRNVRCTNVRTDTSACNQINKWKLHFSDGNQSKRYV